MPILRRESLKASLRINGSSLGERGEADFGYRPGNVSRVRTSVVEQSAPRLILSHGGLDYILRKKGPFFGRFTSKPETVTICNEDYFRYSILCPVLGTCEDVSK